MIKAGFDLQRVTLTAQDAGDSNALFYYKVSPTTGVESIPYQVQFGSPIPGLSPVSVSKNTLFDTFLQDTWTLNKHWTFNLGVRGDYNRTPAYLNYVTPANVVAALNSQAPGAPAGITYAQTLAAGGININNYISNGHNRSAKWNFSPRLGASYDIDGNQKHVIFGGVGRTYNQNLYDLLQVEQTKYVLSQPTILFNTPLQPLHGQQQHLLHLQSVLPQHPGAAVAGGRLVRRQRGGHDAQQPEDAVFRPVLDRHAQPDRRLGYERGGDARAQL